MNYKMLILEKEPNSFEAESYRILRTNIQHSSFFSSDTKSILVTSADSKEEKSIAACNLGLAFVQNGQSVVIIDCDFRKPFIHKIFNISNDYGLVDVLMNTRQLDESMKNYNKDLYILTSGNTPENPSEMLDTHEMDFLIQELKQKFDVVILDGAPLQDVTDAQILATKTDATILAVKSRKSKRDKVLAAKDLLDKVGANIIGAVIIDETQDVEENNSKDKETKKKNI